MADPLVGRPLPEGFETLAADPVASGNLGFQMLARIDHRKIARSALFSFEATARDVIDCDVRNGLDPIYLTAALDAALNRQLPIEHSGQQALPVSKDPVLRLIAEPTRSPHASDLLQASPSPHTIVTNE